MPPFPPAACVDLHTTQVASSLGSTWHDETHNSSTDPPKGCPHTKDSQTQGASPTSFLSDDNKTGASLLQSPATRSVNSSLDQVPKVKWCTFQYECLDRIPLSVWNLLADIWFSRMMSPGCNVFRVATAMSQTVGILSESGLHYPLDEARELFATCVRGCGPHTRLDASFYSVVHDIRTFCYDVKYDVESIAGHLFEDGAGMRQLYEDRFDPYVKLRDIDSRNVPFPSTEVGMMYADVIATSLQGVKDPPVIPHISERCGPQGFLKRFHAAVAHHPQSLLIQLVSEACMKRLQYEVDKRAALARDLYLRVKNLFRQQAEVDPQVMREYWVDNLWA